MGDFLRHQDFGNDADDAGAPGQGSGMGLYIVRSIVQGWGGQAWVERRGERNAFCFTMPGVAGLG